MSESLRSQRAADVAALRSQGLLVREVAERLGLSPSYTQSLISDPDGARERARKERYAGTCVRCGGRTTGCNGPSQAPRLCKDCCHTPRWTKESIVEAIQRWTRENGRKPSAWEWLHADLRPDWAPAVAVIQYHFGTWNAALEAAGLPTETRGKYPRTERTRLLISIASRKLDYDRLLKMYEEGRTYQEIADLMGTTKGTVGATLYRLKRGLVYRR